VQILIYEIRYEIEFVDWRILAMQQLEKKIVCEASSYNIFSYTSEDLAQELRLQLWKGLDSFDPKNGAKLETWANTVIKRRLYELNRFQTCTKKRKDYLFNALFEETDEKPDEMHIK